MKTHITNVYGFVKDESIAQKIKEFAYIGHQLGFYEMGLYVYEVSSDTDSELQKRLDGIISSVEYGDMVVVQLPSGNGVTYERLLLEKICVYSNNKVKVLWWDKDYYQKNREYFDSYIGGERKLFNTNVDELDFADVLNELVTSNNKFGIKVKDIDETLDFIKENHCSVSRFGDGEMDIIVGNSIPYQNYDETLASELKRIISMKSDNRFMVCLSDVFEHEERYNQLANDFWKGHLNVYAKYYCDLCVAPWYGSTFISRPYMDLIDKSSSNRYFDKLKSLWDKKNILIVEGKNSKSGVGNDLFDNTKSVKRIICPSKNAFEYIDTIKQKILNQSNIDLILLMLGPTAKVLSYDLSKMGYWIIDLGHIDSEYEWFKMGATSKVKLKFKHTAEHNFDQDIVPLHDKKYEEEIVVDISDAN